MPAPDQTSAATDSGKDSACPFALSPHDIKRLGREEKIALLRELRVRPVRRPTVTLMLATDVLAGGTSGLGDEQWALTEQCLVAALECGKLDHAGTCLKSLTKKFGDKSIRVRKLAGLCAEAGGADDKARQIYDAILAEAPADQFAVRRQVAILKGQGELQAAIDVLEKKSVYQDDDKNPLKYQEVHALDSLAFRELVNLYAQLGNTEKAIFYAEECILCDPFDYSLHARHGELAYARDQYDRAIAAFSQSLRLNESQNNARAAYGLHLAATKGAAAAKKAAAHKGGNSSAEVAANPDGVNADYKAIAAAAQSHLARMYGGSSNAHLLDMMLRSGK